jgi:hypothetical protein
MAGRLKLAVWRSYGPAGDDQNWRAEVVPAELLEPHPDYGRPYVWGMPTDKVVDSLTAPSHAEAVVRGLALLAIHQPH